MKFKSDDQRKAVMAQMANGRPTTSSDSVPFKDEAPSKDAYSDLEIDGAKIKSSEERDGEAATFHAVETDDGAEYEVYDSHDDAEREAIARVKNDLQDDPSMFSQEWLQNHLYISDTDKRIIAGEEADARLDG